MSGPASALRRRPALRPALERPERRDEVETGGSQAVTLVGEIDDARLAELAQARVEDRGRRIAAAGLQLTEGRASGAQLPQHAQGPAAAEQVEDGHDRPPTARAADGTPRTRLTCQAAWWTAVEVADATRQLTIR